MVEGAKFVEEPSSETPRFGSEQQNAEHEGGVDGGFGADVDVSRSEDGLAQGTEGLAGLGDVVIDINAVVEGFVCDGPSGGSETGRRLG